MALEYALDENGDAMGMLLCPKQGKSERKRRARVMPLAEVKVIGDRYSGSYLGGESMKYSDTTYSLKYDRQDVSDGKIITYQKSGKGLEVIHTVTHRENRHYITVSTELINNTGADITLEMLSSFALCGISPYLDGAGDNCLLLHRARGKWSMEGRFVTDTLEDLLLEDSWTMGHSKSVRFGQVGSMPVKNYFPFIAVEDTKNGIVWGAQMGCPSSWQMEITRADDGVCISGGLADREFGHWMKTIKNGERFKGPEAVITVCEGGLDDLCARLLEAQEDALNVPGSEENLPVIFNEYCTTWGNPSHDNITNILDAIDGKGIDYFVIDCGWFKEDGVRWDISMGDYIPSKTLFPNGISETVKTVKAHNMRPGIWFEPETAGEKAKVYYNEQHLLKRDGITLTTQNRRFWDMKDEWVKKYLGERVIDFLKDNGFGYIKVDYNETIGIGCDNADSLGEGLRQNMLGTLEFFKRMRREIPDLVIENCASGGNRLEPVFMSLSSMASFSDAHECVEIPIIAANLHRLILPRQSQIWCVIRKSDTVQRIAYSVAATFLGRMCLSGDVTDLSAEQWKVIDDGIAFYKKAAPVIKHGKSKIYRKNLTSYRHPEGYQAVWRENEKSALCVVHTFENAPEKITVQADGCKISAVYPAGAEVQISGGKLIIGDITDFSGIGVLLEK